jgi:hypothetical protein
MANIGMKERVDERKARHIMETRGRMWLHEMPTEQKREHILESLLNGENPFPYIVVGFDKGTKIYELVVFVYRHYWSKGLTTEEIYTKWANVYFRI